MSRIFAIDPGTTHSGLVIMVDGRVTSSGVFENHEVLEEICIHRGTQIACEMIASYGMAVGKEVFETCLWIGRFVQAAGADRVRLVYRKGVKLHLCGSPRAKDANIRQALTTDGAARRKRSARLRNRGRCTASSRTHGRR